MSGMLHKADIGCNLKSFQLAQDSRDTKLFSRVGSVFPVNYAGKCPPHRCFFTQHVYLKISDAMPNAPNPKIRVY